MSLELSGKLIAKYEPQEFGEKKFKTREFVIELAEEVNGNVYSNYAKMQLVQAKCDIIDRYNIGDAVKVSFNVRGRSYTDKKDGSTKYITNLDAWRVEPANGATGGAQQQAAPAYNNNNAGGGNNNYSTNNYNQSPEAVDDLPF